MITREFDSYIIYHEQEEGNPRLVVVNCFDGTQLIGAIKFYKGKVPHPEILSDKTIILNFPADRIQEILTTLRYEKPLFLSFKQGKAMLGTIKEPVGEQETEIAK